jgi:hypothetical protein
MLNNASTKPISTKISDRKKSLTSVDKEKDKPHINQDLEHVSEPCGKEDSS